MESSLFKKTGKNIDIPLDEMMNIALNRLRQGEYKHKQVNGEYVPEGPFYHRLEDGRTIQIPENIIIEADKLYAKGITEYHYPRQTENIGASQVSTLTDVLGEIDPTKIKCKATDKTEAIKASNGTNYELILMSIAFLIIMFYDY